MLRTRWISIDFWQVLQSRSPEIHRRQCSLVKLLSRAILTNTQTSTPKQEEAGDIYTQDGDYIRDIEVNDLRNRYTLTKGATQKMVNKHFVMVPLILPGHSFLFL